MVQIPTAADIQRSSARSGRVAPQGPTVSVGAGLADLGRGMVSTAYSLMDLQTLERADTLDKKANDVSTNLTRFLADEEQRFLSAQEGSSESGIGFTRSFMEEHQRRANEFAKNNFEGLSSDAQTRYLNTMLSRGNDLFAKSNSFEDKTKADYYQRTTNTSLDTLRTQIRNNSGNVEALKQQGYEQIDSAAMPEPWKAARRAAWDADAAESRWQWQYSQNPTRAIEEIQGPSQVKSLIRKEEGFRAEPYWDVDAWRIGYGSDTITLADGSQKKVEPGMKITREDAERDLQYRLTQREGAQARKQVGAAWDGLGQNVQAALASVAYNYGSLPSTVASAAKSGDIEAIASSIEGLSANPERRKREAAIVRGSATIQTTDEFADIPYERRQQLAAWGQNEYTRQQTAERAARRDDLALMIASQPEKVSESAILEDQILDNGDKAALLKTYRTAQADAVSARTAVEKLNSGGVFDPYDSDERKGVGLAYDQLSQKGSIYDEDGKSLALARLIYEKSGIVPERAMNELRGGLVSGDAARVALSAGAAASLAGDNPARLSALKNGDELAKAARTYEHMTGTLGMSPVEAGQRMVDMRDPQKQKQREAVLETKAVKDVLKGISDTDVRNIWDTPGPNWATGYKVGATKAATDVMVSDYRAMLEESLVEAAGDMDLAKQYAADRFRKIYGPSPLSLSGEKTITYLPPENFYPIGPDGSHDYIREQLVSALNANPDLVGAHGVIREAFLQAAPETRDDFLAGRPPRYEVYYRDQNGNLQQFPGEFVPDAYTAPTAPRRGSRAAFEQNRNAEMERNEIIESFGRGPSPMDEMNAAADEVRALEQLEADRHREPEGVSVGGGGW